MIEIKHHTIHANNIRQHYMEAGEGVPVVLLHGFPETSCELSIGCPPGPGREKLKVSKPRQSRRTG
jgi:pimeloyl-ACP methyl ester carboxylesterase